MIFVEVPFFDLAVLVPLLGAAWVVAAKDGQTARRRAMVLSAASFVSVLSLWASVEAGQDRRRTSILNSPFDRPVFALDDMSAPIAAAASFIHLLAIIVVSRLKCAKFPFARAVVAQAVFVAAFGCLHPVVAAALISVLLAGPFLESRPERRPTRLATIHFLLIAGLMLAGSTAMTRSSPMGLPLFATGLAMAAGFVPFHLWVNELLERGSFGKAILMLSPMPAVYGLFRFIVPAADETLASILQTGALATAVYAAGLGLVQQDARRHFGCFLISQQALVVVGMMSRTSFGLTGALCLWLAQSVSLAGFGLILVALETRYGRLSLMGHRGLLRATPTLAAAFLLTGLASVGFPGSLSFFGLELVQTAALEGRPTMGALAVVVAALNGISVVRVYMALFAGPPRPLSIVSGATLRERIGAYSFVGAVLLGGMFAHPIVEDAHRAAGKLLPPTDKAALTAASDLQSR
jgi:NADH-quinone oxidoreductase subunit M